MAKHSGQLAKLSRPRLYGAVPRERLFRLIDAQRGRACIWIVSPPGAGKTTLAASYLAEADAPSIWYQLDAGDGDPATFFHYLREAAGAASRRRRPLPLLTPEYRHDLPGFSRRFFRDLFLRLPAGAVVVFDNQHEVAPDSTLHAALAAAIEEVPPNAALLVLSRGDPPKEMARARVSGKLTVIGWDALQLTLDETRAIAASRSAADRAVQQLHQQSSGWAAGLALMLEHPAALAGGQGESLEGIFDYFASQIFDASAPEVREVLVACALPAQVDAALAQALTGRADAGTILQSFHQRRLFVDRTAGPQAVYRFHALFRAFLRDRATQTLGPARTRALTLAAAGQLAARGDAEGAFPLYLEAGDAEAAAGLFARVGPALIHQGRWRTLQEWHALLSTRTGPTMPWADYWLGRALAAIDPPAAKAVLASACSAFVANADALGELLAAAGMLEALAYEFRDVRLMDPWIERTVRLLAGDVDLPDSEHELHVRSGLIAALIYRDPDHSVLGACVQRVEALLGEPSEPNLRLGAASILQMYAQTVVDDRAWEIAARAAQPLLGSPQATAARCAFYWASEGYTHYAFSRHEQAIACCARAETIAAEHGLEDWALTAGTWRGLSERRAGMLGAARATLARLDPLRKPAGSIRLANYCMLQASLAFDRGDTERGLMHAREARACGEQSGQYLHSVLVGSVAANFLIAAGRCAEAAEFLAWGRGRLRGAVSGHMLAVFELLDAWRAQRERDRAQRDAHLCQALRQAHDPRALVRLRWHANALGELLPIALSQGIEAHTAARVARALAIVPASDAGPDWPWPVKVYTLGRFELMLHGQAPDFGRKPPRKSLALLQALIALGGRDVPEERVAAALWPDQEGDSAHRALFSALHRLRKLLGNNSTVRQSGGRLSLNAERCWVDALAFERLLAADADTAGDLHARRQAAIELYRGPFLAQEDDAAWAMPMRERLRGRFVQAVGAQAQACEARGELETALAHYRRGVEADYLVEPFYQGLMRCYAALDRRAEASSAYRTLRQTLSVVLGVAPSDASTRLYRQLRLEG